MILKTHKRPPTRRPWLTPILLLQACINPCEDVEMKRFPSPSAAVLAVVLERSCGATTGFSRHVTILKPRWGGLLSAERFEVFIATGGAVPSVRWLDESSLVISHDKSAKVFRRARDADGVDIRYEAN